MKPTHINLFFMVTVDCVMLKVTAIVNPQRTMQQIQSILASLSFQQAAVSSFDKAADKTKLATSWWRKVNIYQLKSQTFLSGVDGDQNRATWRVNVGMRLVRWTQTWLPWDGNVTVCSHLLSGLQCLFCCPPVVKMISNLFRCCSFNYSQRLNV